MMAEEMGRQAGNASEAHDESEQAIRELEQQVEAAENEEGNPVPSQEDADETAGTGI
jgi:hypothetical protein